MINPLLHRGQEEYHHRLLLNASLRIFSRMRTVFTLSSPSGQNTSNSNLACWTPSAIKTFSSAIMKPKASHSRRATRLSSSIRLRANLLKKVARVWETKSNSCYIKPPLVINIIPPRKTRTNIHYYKSSIRSDRKCNHSDPFPSYLISMWHWVKR